MSLSVQQAPGWAGCGGEEQTWALPLCSGSLSGLGTCGARCDGVYMSSEPSASQRKVYLKPPRAGVLGALTRSDLAMGIVKQSKNFTGLAEAMGLQVNCFEGCFF